MFEDQKVVKVNQ